MIPRLVMAWAALVHDRYLAEMVAFLRDTRTASGSMTWSRRPSTRSSIPVPSGTSRRTTSVGASRLWTTDADVIRLSRRRRRTKPRRRSPSATTERPSARTGVQRPARARHLTLGGTRRSADALGDDDGPAALAGGTHARHVRPRQGADHPGPAGRDMDELGHRAARRRLGEARRAGGLGGDRRLSNLRRAQFATAWGRSARWLRVCLGDSPNSARYWAAKRLRCQNPQSVAAWLTASRSRVSL